MLRKRYVRKSTCRLFLSGPQTRTTFTSILGSKWQNMLSTGWPDWAIFESSWWQIFVARCLNVCWLFGLFWKTSLWSKNCCDYFLDNFWNNLAIFYFNIWSHWKFQPIHPKCCRLLCRLLRFGIYSSSILAVRCLK